MESCLFGVGLVEVELTDNFHLTAMNVYEDLEIYYHNEEANSYHTLIGKSVCSVGYNKDFIIAKSFPTDIPGSVYYHIIETKKVRNGDFERVPYYTKKQFDFLREELNVPKDLEFTINFEDKLTNVKKTVN